MRIKESNNKIAHIAWSPAKIYPAYIASGTAADQLDSSCSKNSTLDLLKLDLSTESSDLELAATITTESKFSKLIWTEYASANSQSLIIGGCENGKIYLYDYEKILANQDARKSVVQVLDKHVSSSSNVSACLVGALDINPFQNNLLASGAGASEIFIWDLNNPETPMTPGAKLQPLDDINCLAWNHQKQHILASTSSGKCIVWDLRKNESIIKVSDSMSKMRAKLVNWHPEVATQMCLASEDDNTPFMQIWDLRFATAPVRVLEGHQRGILASCWSSLDSNLLLSSAKDSRILCWNPNNATVNGEILFELPTNSQWCFDLDWSRRNPNLIGASSYEGQINVYSLMGGRYNMTHQTSSTIMDSFGVLDNTAGNANLNLIQKVQQEQTTHVVQQLKLAPKWMKRPCGASFAFGGKLVTFGSFTQDPAANPDQLAKNNQQVVVNQVITDPDLVQNSYQLGNVLQTSNFVEYCNYKMENAKNQSQSFIWNFILATFHQNKNEKFISLLGFSSQALEKRTGEFLASQNGHQVDDDFLAKQTNSKLGLKTAFTSNDDHNLASSNKPRIKSTSQANEDDDTFNDIARSMSPVTLSFENDIDRLTSELLVLGQYEKVVDLLIQETRFTDAILIANFFDKNLFAKTQQAYFRHNSKNKFSNLVEKFLNRDWTSIVKTCNLENWKEALATVLTYTQDAEQLSLCTALGERLEYERSMSSLLNACICYICAPHLDSFVQCWQKLADQLQFSRDSESLQDLIEKVMILKYSFSLFKHQNQQQDLVFTKFYSKLIEYAKLLADQGCSLNAYNYLNDLNDIMKDRLFNSLDAQTVQQYRLRKPDSPFKTTQEIYSKAKASSASSTNAAPSHSIDSYQQTSSRKPIVGYHAVADPSMISKPQTINNYNNYNQFNTGVAQHQTANSLNTPFMPVASAGHPMPMSSIYAASAANANQSSSHPSMQYASSATAIKQQIQVPSISQTPTALFAPTTTATATANGNTNIHPALGSQTSSPPSYMHARPPTAWNDPPLVAPKVRAPSAKDSSNADPMPTFFQPGPAQTPASQFYYPQPSILGGGNFQANDSGNSQYGVVPQMDNRSANATPMHHQSMQHPQQVATQVLEKAPIPAEHLVLKTVLDTLLLNCINASNQPTVKRKLDDVSKKLDFLYDKLRDSALSANVVQGLHTIIQYIRANDFQSALIFHSNLVAVSNFSEISGFMPGIKVLIQSCQQFNVHL